MSKKKAWSILLIAGALFSGALFVLYHLIIWWRLAQEGLPYSFFSFATPDPIVNLAPMLRDVLDGHWWVSDGRIFEHRTLPNLWSFLDPLLIAPLTFLFKDVSTTFLTGHFLVGALTFIVIYLLAKRFTESRWWSFIFSFTFLAAPLLVNYLFPTSLEHVKVVGRTLLPFGGPPGEVLMSKYVSFSVLPGLPLFALAFLALLNALERRTRRSIGIAGLTIGLLLYVYITDVVYLFVSMGLMGIIFLVRKNFSEFRACALIVLIAVASSAAYWLNFARINALPWAEEFYLRLGGELTHAFRTSQIANYIAYIVFAVVVWVLGRRFKEEVKATYLVGFILSAPALLNIQMITGYNPAPSAWAVHQLYFGFALAVLAVAFWIYQMARWRSRRWGSVYCGLLVLISVMIVGRIIYTNVFIARDLYPAHTIPEELTRTFDWINKNIPRDAVVATPSLVTGALLPVYTHASTMMPVAVTSPASHAEIVDRMYVTYTLFDVAPEYLRDALTLKIGKLDEFAHFQESALPTVLFESFYVDRGIDGYFFRRTMDIPDVVVEKLVADYIAYPRRLEYVLSRYRVDYLYVGPYEARLMNENFDSAPEIFAKVFDERGVKIYKIIRS